VKKLSPISSYERWVRCSNFPGSKRMLVGMSKLKFTSQDFFAAHISYFGCINCTQSTLSTTDYDSQTRAKLLKRSTKVLQRLNETLKNADLHENFCACSKLIFWTSVLLRSPTITDDYSVNQLSHKALLAQFQRPWTITNVSSNIIER